jgi:superfamily II DNA or RNA helicase
MEKLPDCKYRFGLTGTLDGTESNKLVLSGLFDVPKKVVSTKELMDAGTISKLKINSLILNHSVPDKKIAMRVKTYQEECDYLVLNAARNQFISRLATTLEGNTLVLFQYVEKHGIPLTEQIRSLTTKNVRYISGMVKSEEREETRDVTEANDDVIIVASYQTYSTGINIKNLHNIIFAFPTKSQVRVLQSIGRGLRLHDSKDKCNVYDIADDIRKGKKKNYTLNHFYARYNIYNEAEFDVSTEIINL